jgi:hypothetical protein
MTSQPDLVLPPHFAAWLVNLFTPAEEAESILGDLLEEYSHLASKSGVAFARSWYWRQTVKTIAHLIGNGFRVAPWSITAAVIGGFLLHRFVSGLPDRLLSAVTDRYLAYWSNHFRAYMFWATDGMLIVRLIASMLVGCSVGLAAKGREMIATMSLSLVLGAMTGVAWWLLLASGRDPFLPWMLPLCFADWFAIVIGGAIVRTRRSATTTLPSVP